MKKMLKRLYFTLIKMLFILVNTSTIWIFIFNFNFKNYKFRSNRKLKFIRKKAFLINQSK